MVGIDEVTLFEADEHSYERSIVFAIVVATGFLAVVSGVITLMNETGAGVGIAMLIIGFGLLGGSAGIAMGMADDALFDR